ncbi:MAG TPA: hypothetical protein VN665_04125 [Candidatus Paceibacterota bacterium]|nr:hypothetical protein [Candidatus Paceibacterota bacterium]
MAQSILQGHYFDSSTDNSPYEYFHTPGYPSFVAVLLFISGGSFFTVTLVQIILVFAIAIMTMLLGQVLISKQIGQWASILFLANPLVPSIALYVLTDTVFMFLLTAGFCSLVFLVPRRPLWGILSAGLIFGAAVYVRPIGSIAFPIFIALLFALPLSWYKKFALSIGMLAIIVTLMLPWMIRNKIDSGVFSFSSLFSLNMAFYEIPHYWTWHGTMTLSQAIQKVAQESGVPEDGNAAGYPTNWYNLASSPAINHFVIQAVLQSPFSYGVWHLYNSVGGFFLNPAINPPNQQINLKQLLARGRFDIFFRSVITPWWLLLERIGIAFGLLFVAFGIWNMRYKPFAWAFLFVIFYFSILGGSAAESRLRLPVEPLISILLVSGAVYLLERIFTKALKPHLEEN